MKRITILILALALGALLIPQRWVSLGAPNVSGSLIRQVAEPQRQAPPERLVGLKELDSLPLADVGDAPLGRDPRRWREFLASKTNQRFQEVFPGVDLVFAGTAKRMEAILIVKPGVDPASIRFDFPQAEVIAADAQANIWVATPGGDLGFMRPLLSRQNEKVSGSFAAQGSRVVLQVQDHDPAQGLLVRFDVVFPERAVNLLDQILYRTFKAENYQPTSPASPEQTTTVTATKSVDNPTVAPGGTLMYTVTIANTGATTANGVQFTDTISNNTTLVGGSVASSPVAVDDTYTATGNIPIAPSAGLLANDINPDTGGGSTGLTVSQVQGSGANVGVATNTTATGIGGVNGSVTVQSNGSFTYEPPPGFTGSDTFTYQATGSASKVNNATVTITISNMVWFIDNTSAAANSRGTFSQPFKTIAAFNAINTGAAPNAQPGHHVVLRPAGGTYAETDGINLRDNQTLTGSAVAFNTVFVADANSTAAYTTFAASVGAAPTITTTAGDGVDLASGNAVRGLNVGNTPGFYGFDGTSVGSLTIGTVSKTGTGGAIFIQAGGAFGSTVNFGTLASSSSPGPNIYLANVTGTLGVTSGGTGLSGSAASSHAIDINSGSVSMTYPGNVTKNNLGSLLHVFNHITGTLTFNTGTLNASAGDGLQFDNADGTYNFNGTTTLNGGDAGVDIFEGSGGTFSFGTGTTITSPTGIAFNVDGTAAPVSANVTYSGNITQANAAAMVNVKDHGTGTITFQTGTLSATNGTGLQFNNADGTYNFNGTTTLNGGDAGIDITTGSGGTFSFNSNTTITNPSGIAYNEDTSTAGVTYSGTITQNNANNAVNINAKTGGTTAFSGAITASTTTANAIDLTSNGGGTINFTGGLTLTASSGVGFNATGGGTTIVTGASNTITTGTGPGTGTGLNVTSTNIGASGLTFLSINVNGASKGIVLNSTGTGAGNGGLTVTGTGTTDGSGGTIQNISTRGGEFITTKLLSLKNMNFTNANTTDGGTCTDLSTSGCNAAIYLSSVATVTLDNINITGTTAQEGINGLSVSNFTLSNSTIIGTAVSPIGNAIEEGCIKMRELTGTCAITNCDLAFPAQDVVEIVNTTGPTLTLNATSTQFRDSQSSGNGGNGLQARSQGTASMVINVTSDSFLRLRTNGVQATAINSATQDIDITSNTFDPGTGTMIGIDLDADNTGNLVFNVQNNTKIYSRNGPAVNVFGDTNAVINGRINNNPDVKVLNNVGSNVGSGIRANINKDATAKIEIKTNVVNVASDDAGIDLSGIGKTTANPGGATNTLDATVTGNNVTIGATSTYGIIILSATNAGDTNAICANVATNAITRNPSSIFSFRARVPSANGFFRMNGFVTNAEATWNANGNTPMSVAGSEVSFGGSGTFASCTAALPTNPGPNFAPPIGSGSTSPQEMAATEPQPHVAPPVESGGSSRFINRLMRPVFSAYAVSMGYVNPLKWFEGSAAAAPANLTAEKPAVEVKPAAKAEAKEPARLPSGLPSGLNAQQQPQRAQRTEGKAEAPQRQQPKPPTRILTSPTSGDTIMVGPFNLPPGESVQIMFSVTVTGTTGCTISNQATVSGTNFSPVTTNAAVTSILQAPSAITCPSNITTNTDPGLCTAVVNFTTPTASAGCPTPTVTCVPATGATFVKGTTTVTCTASNGQGSPTMCSFTVTVNDNQAPTLMCSAPVMANTDPNVCTAVVTYTTTITDNCPGATFTCTPASGATFVKGVTTVNCTGMDANSNPATPCSFTVTVVDNQNPVIGACPTNITQPATAGACSATVTYTPPTATDNCGAAPVVCAPASGSIFNVGTTTVTCTATDTSNRTASCMFTVTIQDTEAPTIMCPPNQTVSSNVPIIVNYPAPTASDNCGTPTVVCAPASGTVFPVGTTTVTCTASDTSAQSPDATCMFTVSVVPCTVSCPMNQTATAAPNTCAAVVNYPAPTTTGTCGTVTCVPASGLSFPVGTTTVTCTSAAGPSCMFTVTVTDTQLPTLTCPVSIVTNTAPNTCAATVTYTTPTASDNCPGATVTCAPASGTSFAKGVTTVTCTAKDASNNMAMCTFTVTVNDNQNPSITCPANIALNTGAGICTAVATYTTPTPTDNCPGATAACVPASGTTFAKGVTTVTCTATDASNNTAACTFTVTVTDNQNPVIGACPTNITQPATAGACSATATYTPPTATDNCGAAPVVCAPASGSTFNVGTTTVTCTATDTSNLTAACMFTVTIQDTQAPTIMCPPNQTVSSNVPIIVNYPAPTASDNCGAPTVVCVPASGSVFVVGTTTVTCTASDTSVNSPDATCMFTVSVVPCTVICPSNQTATAAAGLCSAVVNYPAPTTTGTCGTVTCVPASGASFNVGITTVTCTAAVGPSCMFTVTVTDTQLPTLTCPANIVTNTAPGICTAVATYTTPTASDNCPGATVTCAPASGSTFQKGVTTVTCTAKDASNNMAMCTFTVTVNDNQNPSITCPANIALNTGAGICTAVATYTTPTPTDNCPGATAACVPASGSTFQKGVTTVTCTATDASNNTAACTFTVTVTDNQNPTITCPANISTNTAVGLCSAAVTFTTPTPTDNCPGATVACVPASGSTFQKGVTTVTCTATDTSNNTANCTFTVTVVDNQNPTITCPANQQAVSPGGPIAVNYPAPTAADNCPGVTTACVPASGSTFPLGTTTVNCTATDAVNRTATCSFTVTVVTCTSITCPTDIFVGTTGNSTTVTYTLPTANGNCGTITCSPPSGSTFNVGVTTVSCSSSIGNQTCAFRVTVNRVSGSISDPLSCTGPGNTVSANVSISNNGAVNQNVVDTVTFTNLVGVPGSCTTNIGTCTVTNSGVTYTGTLTPGQTATITYLTQVSDLALPGAQVCTNNSVTFNGGPALLVSACGTVTCPAPGPGNLFPAASEASDQKAGSVLIYNVYTSGATSANTQNTRLNITNVHPVLSAFVHIFFVAEGCSIADSYICLTGNQTASFLASDFDPGTTGYLVAVAVDGIGCPRNFNYLIGDEYVKFTSGHAANLGAEAFAAIPGGRPTCDGNSVTAQLNFDGVSYNRTPAVLALDSVGSRADGNDTLLIINRIGGNLGIGASTLGTLFGVLYDDAESSLSFSVSGNCQLRSSLSNNFPRTTPRFETFIPAGRTGWLKIFNQTGAIGITGSAINFNPNAGASAGAFNQGHNLHHLTLNATSSYTIPIFPPSC